MTNDKIESAVVLFSGGQDSTTCLYLAMKLYCPVYPIAFFYGQKHSVELECARQICKREGLSLKEVDISFIGDIVISNLISGGNVNEKHELKPSLPASFVPNRNQLFLTIAHGYAQTLRSKVVIIGACQTDYSGYPDCRDDFIKALQMVSNFGSDSGIRFDTPLMWRNKAETFMLAEEIGALKEVIELSHTCYNGDHSTLNKWGYGCGECPACKLRAKGFAEYVEFNTELKG